jgi:hypothetical protein
MDSEQQRRKPCPPFRVPFAAPRRLLARKPGRCGYVAAPKRDGWQRSKAFGRSFHLERSLDDFGLWNYKLHIREE